MPDKKSILMRKMLVTAVVMLPAIGAWLVEHVPGW